MRARTSAWYHERKDDPEFKAQRLEQGKVAGKRWRDSNQEFCRRRIAEYRAANRPAIRETEAQWRAANPDRVRAKHHRRRARFLDAFVEEVDLSEVWERDEGTCGICKEPIDLSLKFPHRMSRTLDHVIPLARGGTHEMANVQLAHMSCNARKNKF